jgi:hypothetical protein
MYKSYKNGVVEDMELVDNKVYFLVKEFEKLKDEQNKRIEFRDHMIYITLGVIGTVFSFILEKPEFNTALLVLPFICIILGWTYLMNDEKVTEIGVYIKNILIPIIEKSKSDPELSLHNNWEVYHKKAHNRASKKVIQLILDIMLFCFSALFSIISFFYFNNSVKCYHVIIALIESVLILYLASHFIISLRLGKHDK